MIEDPPDLGSGEIRVQEQARLVAKCLFRTRLFQGLAGFRCTAILPDDRAMDGNARFAVPYHGRFPLVRDPDASDVPRLRAGLHHRLLHHIPLRRPDLPRVMLHPARFRKVLIEFLPGDGPDAGVCIENNGPGTGGALIQGEYDLRHSAFLRTLWNEGCRVCTIRQASK